MTGNSQILPKRFRFSVIDFVIVLLVLASLCGILVRYDVVGRLFSKSSLVEAEVFFVAEAVPPTDTDAFMEGNSFYENGTLFGTLRTVKSEKALIYTENHSGVLVSYEDDTLLDLNGSFLCKVLPSEKGYLLNGNRYLAPGTTLTLRAESIQITVTILSIVPTS